MQYIHEHENSAEIEEEKENEPANENVIQQINLQTIPAVLYKETEKSQACELCLDIFNEGDSVKTLECMHVFHARCIDNWMRSEAKCPVCNININN